MRYNEWINNCGCGCNHSCHDCDCEDIYMRLSNLGTDIEVLQDEIDALSGAVEDKQDKLTAGTGIDITNNVISATGGGTGSNITFAVTGTKLVVTVN